MKTAEQRLADARIDERLARARWFDTLELMQERTEPATIADEAIEHIRETAGKAVARAGETVRENPGTVIAIGSVLGLFLFRKPIYRAVRTMLSRRKETSRTAETLSTQQQKSVGPRPDPTPKTISEEVSR